MLIVSLLPLHSAAVTQEDSPAYTSWHEGDLVLNYGTIVKPIIPYYDKTLLDKAEELLAIKFKGQCVDGVKKILGITNSLGTRFVPIKKTGKTGDITVLTPIHIATRIGAVNGMALLFECNYDWKENCRIVEMPEDEIMGYLPLN